MTGLHTGVWEFEIDKVPPGGFVLTRFFFVGFVGVYKLYSIGTRTSLEGDPPIRAQFRNTNELRYSFEGRYQFQSEIKPGTQHFFVPIIFSTTKAGIYFPYQFKLKLEIGILSY